MILFTAFVTVY